MPSCTTGEPRPVESAVLSVLLGPAQASPKAITGPSVKTKMRFTGSPCNSVRQTDARFGLTRHVTGIHRMAGLDRNVTAKSFPFMTQRYS